MNPGDRIGPYLLEARLGKGVTASTWRARRGEEDTPLVLKLFDLAEADSWKSLDLFRREADVLRTLHHPGIPTYIDSFEFARDGHLLFVLVMEYIPGETVESFISSGRKFTEERIEALLAELCDILAYIGSLRPPVVHRDINPRNIIIRPDGHLVLVDFSSVQDAIRTALYQGATLVGTAGYIPLEQVSGRATHRSDLYGAAATAVFMLTGRNPAELPMRNLKIDLSGLLYLSPRLAYVLDNWLDPDPDRRTLSAASAADILRGEKELPSVTPQKTQKTAEFEDEIDLEPTARHLRRIFNGIENARFDRSVFDRPAEDASSYPDALPADSRIVVQDLEPGIYIKQPRGSTLGGHAGLSLFPIAWLGFVFFWTTMTLRMRAPIFFPLFSIPFWVVGITMAKTLLGPRLSDTELFITPDGILLRHRGVLSANAEQYPLADIGRARVTNSSIQVSGRHLRELSIEAGTKKIIFGQGLSDRELFYLEKRINEEIERLRKPV